MLELKEQFKKIKPEKNDSDIDTTFDKLKKSVKGKEKSVDVKDKLKMNVEKSLQSTEFTKTGKEIIEKLKELNNKYQAQNDLLRSQNTSLKGKIGEEPTRDYNSYDTNMPAEKLYKIDYLSNQGLSECKEDVMVSTESSASVNTVTDPNEQKETYNDNVRRIMRNLREIKEHETLMRNIKPNQTIKLSLYDLRELEF